MFNQLFRHGYHITKHTNVPLLEERLNYLRYWQELGKPRNTILSIANKLLRIVEYLQLDIKDVVTLAEVEDAADRWSRYSNHLQKRAYLSRKKERFIWYATHWLTKLDRLKLPVETVTPLFQKIFTRAHTVRRHTTAALLEERLMYLQHWYDVGAATLTLGTLAQYLLIIIQYLNFYQVRIVTLEEIEKAANCWERDTQNIYRKNKPSQSAKKRFIRDAVEWFNMLGCLQKQPKEPIPFEEYLNGYISYMRHEQGLSEQTILARFFQLRRFLADAAQYQQEFI
jgi:integrase/recombinase XerD